MKNEPQTRERYFCVGLRKAVLPLKKFKFPEQSPHKPPKSSTNIDKLLDVSLKTLAVQSEEPRTTTEKRNWADLVAKWDEQGTFAKHKKRNCGSRLGVVKDLQKSFLLEPLSYGDTVTGLATWLLGCQKRQRWAIHEVQTDS